MSPTQVVQLATVHAPATAAVDSIRGADLSMASMEESEDPTCQQQQHQHVTDQLGNLSMRHGQSACLLLCVGVCKLLDHRAGGHAM